MSITVHPAEEADLDRLTAIAIEGFPRDPQWTYRHPYRLDFPEDHYKFTRMRYSDVLANPESYKFMVAEIASSPSESSTEAELVALSIWRMPGVEEGPPAEKFKSRRDTSPNRLHKWKTGRDKAKEEYFDRRYANQYLSLLELVSRPSVGRKGVATKLMHWGMGLAREIKCPVTIFGGPFGEPLYRKLGFGEVGRLRVEGDERQDYIDYPALVWEAE